jgi:hypothetical protein
VWSGTWEHDQPLTTVDGPPFEAAGICPQVYVQDLLDNEPRPTDTEKSIALVLSANHVMHISPGIVEPRTARRITMHMHLL